ncbi:MAG: hypothetical protein ACKO3I_02395, partial [Synechococcales cyanobacterium]
NARKIPWKYHGMGAKIGNPVTACPEQIYQWRCSAYRRRQNRYAKNREGLHRAVTVQRFVHK